MKKASERIYTCYRVSNDTRSAYAPCIKSLCSLQDLVYLRHTMKHNSIRLGAHRRHVLKSFTPN